ncbi:vacuolar protein sorting-associated protein 32 homolog 2-like isoform X1 [Syzygium oleosum]|uniref:vacuolar protein sorting-associated protein 32 homolog 2-like isoform X1 n=1 Tax=Syzygium oleosum TaxID=219896 RepID=UPI0024B8AF01|nr:vacuolar protein sorting-associated protein 32 homolog 2-like isoform X1 [Syzygium oleosum]
MLDWLFKKRRLEAGAQPLTTLDKLNETLEMLEKKEKLLKEKASQEVEKAKEFTGANNKRTAIQCLKRKRPYEQQIEQLENFQLQILDQMIMLEGAEAATETVDALRTGAAAMEAMYVLRLLAEAATETVDALRTGAAAMEAMNIHDVDNIADEIIEQYEAMKRMQAAVSAPSGAAADFDEDELEAELEELEGAVWEEQLLPPAETASAVPFFEPAGLLPAPPVPQGTAREDEPEGTELEEQLLLPAATASAAPVHVIAVLLPAPPGSPGTDKDDETC